MSLPVAITVSGPGRLYFDLEFVPTVVDRPRDVTLTVNPRNGRKKDFHQGWAKLAGLSQDAGQASRQNIVWTLLANDWMRHTVG